MGFLFGRKSSNKTDKRDVDPSYDEDEDDDDIGSVPKEVTTEGGRRSSSSRSLSRWLGGGGASKKKKKGKEKKKKKNNNNNNNSSTSTASSDEGQARNGKGEGPPPTRHSQTPFQASQLQSKITEASNENLTPRSRRQQQQQQQQQQQDDLDNSLCSLPPAAKDAAFEGPTRFDWIDVVSSI
ncbi:MAG: hypothetical protein ACI8RD_002771 [Bacillariaceae sp.]|jgi:hypothetical protein